MFVRVSFCIWWSWTVKKRRPEKFATLYEVTTSCLILTRIWKNLIGDCLFCLKLQAIDSSSKQEPIYFSIQSYQFISSFLQTGTCSNIDIVLQNIRSLYSVVIHKLNRSYDYVERLIRMKLWYIYTLPWSESKYITNFSNNKNRLSLFILCIANWLYVIVNSMLTSLTYL